MKRALLALVALLFVAGVSPAFAAETWYGTKVDIGHGVLCEARVGGTNWPVDGTNGQNAHFYYCGPSTSAHRAERVYEALKQIGAKAHINTLMQQNNVRVYVMDSVLVFADASGADRATTYGQQLNTPAFSLFTADGSPENGIVVYDNVPDTSAGHSYPDLKVNPATIEAHDSLHEAGHHFDRHNGTLSDFPDFIDRYNGDTAYESQRNPTHAQDTVKFAYWWGSRSELFAEEFAISAGSSRRPVDPKTSSYFRCTLEFTSSYFNTDMGPSAPCCDPTQ